MDDFIRHFGILGQKWGVRRFQNEDGTLTEEGKKRYYKDYSKEADELSWQAKELKTQYDDVVKNGWKAKSFFDDDELGDVIVLEYGKKKADEILKKQILDLATSLALYENQARYKREMADFFKSAKSIRLEDILDASNKSTRRMGKEQGIDDDTVSVVAGGKQDQERAIWKNKYRYR